jgi:hypothetical protein
MTKKLKKHNTRKKIKSRIKQRVKEKQWFRKEKAKIRNRTIAITDKCGMLTKTLVRETKMTSDIVISLHFTIKYLFYKLYIDEGFSIIS